MAITDVISCMSVVAFYNPNMEILYEAFQTEEPLMEASQSAVDNANANGIPIYETLTSVQVNLANAIHDYIYNVAWPLDSMMTKNVAREQMCREFFGLSATF
jgi:hypothetical protein